MALLELNWLVCYDSDWMATLVLHKTCYSVEADERGRSG